MFNFGLIRLALENGWHRGHQWFVAAFEDGTVIYFKRHDYHDCWTIHGPTDWLPGRA